LWGSLVFVWFLELVCGSSFVIYVCLSFMHFLHLACHM
jgi:hypothetical protein